MKFEIVNILATGSYKRFMYMNIDGIVYKIIIPNWIYVKLREKGVITSQKRRYLK